ncbi:MAG: hypothetical protein MHM6MM_002506 [Cercozoa sp. M6MM]
MTSHVHRDKVEKALSEHGISQARLVSVGTLNDIVYYECELRNSSLIWNVFRRFQDFETLRESLRTTGQLYLREIRKRTPPNEPPFPTKASKIWTDHLSASLVHERHVLLNNFLQFATSATFVQTPAVVDFVLPNSTDNCKRLTPLKLSAGACQHREDDCFNISESESDGDDGCKVHCTLPSAVRMTNRATAFRSANEAVEIGRA